MPHRSAALFQISGGQPFVAGSDVELLPISWRGPADCQAMVVLSADRSDSSRSAYSRARVACAKAKLGSISTARFNSGKQPWRHWGVKFPSCAVSFERFEGRGRRLREGSVVLLDGGQRFAHPISKAAGNLAQGVEYIFLFCCLHLFLIEDLARAATLGQER